MTRTRWPAAELDETLARGAQAQVELECSSAAAAKSLRQALYHRRRRGSASACEITLEGKVVRLRPLRDEILSARIISDVEF